MMDYMKKVVQNKLFRYVVLTVLGLMACISVYQGCQNALRYSQDFQWDCAKALVSRISPYSIYFGNQDPSQYEELAEFYSYYESIDAPQRMEPNQFPSLLWLLLPYTLMSANTARIAWLISNLFFTIGIIWLLRKLFFENVSAFDFYVPMLLMLSGTPYRNQLGVGQHSLFAFFFFLLAVWFMRRKKGEAGAIICLFVCYFKYTLTAPLVLYFIYKKRYRPVIVSIAMHVVLTVFSAVWLSDSVVNMIKLPLRAASWLSAEGGLDLGALLGGSMFAYVIAFVVMLLLLWAAVKLPEGEDALLLSVLVMWSMILTYHRSYDFFVLAAVSAILIPRAAYSRNSNSRVTFTYWIGYLLVVLGVYFVLRVFSESVPSRIGVGIIYYGFTIYLTVRLFMCLPGARKFINKEV